MLKLAVFIVTFLFLACGLGYAEYFESYDYNNVNDGAYIPPKVMETMTIRPTPPQKVMLENPVEPATSTDVVAVQPVQAPTAQLPVYGTTAAGQIPAQQVNSSVQMPVHRNPGVSTQVMPAGNPVSTTRSSREAPVRVDRQYVPRR